ncbi:MAG: hypothetical protein NTY53_10655 [Kiritimatiellaeota bacterium]|nr:hypothetical protein [Kiritimatiellota bacterium]
MWRWLLAVVSVPAGLVVAFIVYLKLALLLPSSTLSVASSLMMVLLVLATIIPPAMIAPRRKLVVACTMFGIDIIYLLVSLPPTPATIVYTDLAVAAVVGIFSVGLVGYRFGWHEQSRAWPPPLARVGQNRIVRRLVYAFLPAILTSDFVLAVSYRSWGNDPNEQFQRGFPFREIYGSKWGVGFNIDHLGAWLNLCFWMALWVLVLYLAGIAWKWWRQRTRHE